MSFNWHAIRALNGSQNSGFEEFCCQLAREESPSNSKFIRKGTPDAGVECYCILENGNEWGWQAKYFNNFGDSQWNQLDESVQNAINKHPHLTKYFICIPLDRPDARIRNSKSAKEKWDTHVLKWMKWATDKDMNLEFIYWGSSELLEKLISPLNIGKQKFWFEAIGFDLTWFQYRLESAIQTAGPRYTPEIHVDLPIAQDFQTFGRTKESFDKIRILFKELRDKRKHFEYNFQKISEISLEIESVNSLVKKIQWLEEQFKMLEYKPAGDLEFRIILTEIDKTLEIAYEAENLFGNCDKETQSQEPTKDYTYNKTPCGEGLNSLRSLNRQLRETRSILHDVDQIISKPLLILKGDAGTGKTHLLCDLAKHRIDHNLPTILLMGQQFTTDDLPWNQMRSHLDLPLLTQEEFVGALESAAQASDSRALIIIDAINEGSGRKIWPVHLAAFLSIISRSPWIAVVLSIRSSYIDILPKEIFASAYSLAHHGFEENEYDAVKSFFLHYDLELPSAPLLTPEFQNPLFLKTLCSGLKAVGERRLPRGLQGISAIFELYLSSVNAQIAAQLDYRPSKQYVQKSIKLLTEKMIELDSRWINLDVAEETVNSLYPLNSYENSLFRQLMVIGIIGEEMAWVSSDDKKEVVYFGYERLADHLIAKHLLTTHLDKSDPRACFQEGGGLHFLLDNKHRHEAGLLEALCIQVPEETNCELIALAPRFLKYWGIHTAFFNSVIWRSAGAFTEESRNIFNKLIRNEHQMREALDSLLIVAVIPHHPFNAIFLHNRLLKDTMAERDSWWAIYLHKSWSYKGSVYRIVDWALSVLETDTIENDVIELTAIPLIWSLSSSNRFLRDRATKALVNILTGRLDLAGKCIDRFAGVNDLYISERLYAVAYGIAMRCNSSDELDQIAMCIYEHVFANGQPPVHILLRDYARGVIERALYLGSSITVDVNLIRPPYKSIWPDIPSEEDIQEYLPDWSKESRNSDEIDWSSNRIGSSVMSDDFARYVIGTNSWSTNFLSLTLEDPLWQSIDEQLEQLVKDFSSTELEAWQFFSSVDRECQSMKAQKMLFWFMQKKSDDVITDDIEIVTPDISQDTEMQYSEERRDIAYKSLLEKLSNKNQEALEFILEVKDKYDKRPPYFDLKQIQRYVLWRVFNLGWSTDYFGEFDRFTIGYTSREAGKAERIGKKYQWIAYHEIMAYITDHFQYREDHIEDEYFGKRYQGPWQIGLRDIDPSITLTRSIGGTSWKGHNPSWWCSESYDLWGKDMSPEDWVKCNDMPKIEKLLTVTDKNNINWLNLHGYFNWQMPRDISSDDSEHREIWYIINAYLINIEDVDKFYNWSKTVNFTGRWMPDPRVFHEQFFGEHEWSCVSRYHRQPYFSYDGWASPKKDCPVELHVMSAEYNAEKGSFDCSVDEGYHFYALDEFASSLMNLKSNGVGADFDDSMGKLAVYDPSVKSSGPSSLLIRQDLISSLIADKQLTICWVIIGEKRVFNTDYTDRYNHTHYLNGAYIFRNDSIEGFMNSDMEIINDGDYA